MAEPRNPSGTNDPTITMDDLREVMDEYEPYVSSELAERLGQAPSTVNRRLNQFAEEDKIYKRKPNARTVIWQLRPDRGLA